jgi:hypothetical protein
VTRLTVDGHVVLDRHGRGLVRGIRTGPRAGLYLYTPARVFGVTLYVKPLVDDSIRARSKEPWSTQNMQRDETETMNSA